MTARRKTPGERPTRASLDVPADAGESVAAPDAELGGDDDYTPNEGQSLDADGRQRTPRPRKRRRKVKGKRRKTKRIGAKRTGARRKRRGAGGAGQPIAAVGAALFDVLKAIGKLIATVWRLAGALDAALWNGFVVTTNAIASVIVAAAGFLVLSAIDLLRWLPTPAGRAYVAGSSVIAIIAALWILDEMRGAALDAGATRTVIAPPQDSADPIVARAAGRFIRLSEVAASARAMGRLGENETLTIETAFKTGLVERFAEQRLLAQAAVESGVNRDPEVAQKMAIARERILAAAYMEDRVAAATDPERLRRLYDSQSDLVRLGDEVRARHIVVETEVEAEELLASLKDGADFNALARARSLDRSTGPRGGEIGYFTRHMMTPVLANAAFTTGVGDYAPLFFSPYGWHVLQVLDRRPAPSVRYEAVEGRIHDFVVEQTIADTVETLTEGDEIVYFRPEARPEALSDALNSAQPLR